MTVPEKYHVCLRAFARSEKAIERGDLGAGLDWMQAAISDLIRVAEDEGQISRQRRPRRLSAQRLKGRPGNEGS
jgi:hypothetical protein